MDKLEEIRELLERHIGKGNPVSAQVIQDKYGNPTDKTHRKARDLVLKCADKYELPVAGNDEGYYIISTQEEMDEYKANLRSRISGIQEREEKMERYFKVRNK